jgi:hypothetical protein
MRRLRAKIVESDVSQASVVDEVSRGIDHISDSDAGRSFAAFSQLVLDPALGAAFEADIRRILDRGFARDLTSDERRALRAFLTTLKGRSAEIHDVITLFARALRRYVQSQDYQRDRVCGLCGGSARGVQAAAHTRPWHPTFLTLDLSAVALSSVGAIDLHDPAELAATEEIVTQTTSSRASRSCGRSLAKPRSTSTNSPGTSTTCSPRCPRAPSQMSLLDTRDAGGRQRDRTSLDRRRAGHR